MLKSKKARQADLALARLMIAVGDIDTATALFARHGISVGFVRVVVLKEGN